MSTGHEASGDRLAHLGELGESLGRLRLLEHERLRQMQLSLLCHGQLTPLTVFVSQEGLEVIDGFKRLRAARELGWSEIRIRELLADLAQAKVAMLVCNQGRGLSELEEAWLIRSLHRDDRLPQPQIARLLSRDKSWVYRRLLLAEGLCEAVQGDVRLGLLSARSAAELGRLSRDNQAATAEIVVRRGLTCGQTARLVAALCACPDRASREALLAAQQKEQASLPARGPARKRPRTPAEQVLGEVTTITQICARLQARLHAQPPETLGERAGALVASALEELLPVLAALGRTIERVSRVPQTKEHSGHAAVE